MTGPDPVDVLGQIVDRGWLVGGAVRDRLLGRSTADFDVVVDRDAVRKTARALGKAVHAFSFELSETFGGWRVVAHDHSWQLDLLPLEGTGIEDDLRRRDFTVNAVAAPLGEEGYVDPTGGLADLAARRLRAVSPDSFSDDPLRVMRLARLACELGFGVEDSTLELARRSASTLPAIAPERVFAELKRVVVCERVLQGLELMDRAGAMDAVLPELTALRGVEQSRYHHLDVFDHTLAVLAEAVALERDPARVGGDVTPALTKWLASPLANDLTRGQSLRFGALLHDIAKPVTRAVSGAGRVTFIGHDEQGAELGAAILSRLRASDRLQQHVAALARHHLRLGFLVHEMPLSRRAIYDYLLTTSPVAVDVTVLSVADRLATRGEGSEVAIARHLELARQMVAEALAWEADPPRPPVRGDELAHSLGIRPGPVVGELLAQLRAASFSGEISGRDEALELARRLFSAKRG